MKLSIITPTHNSAWLLEAWHSLRSQTGNWEWILVPNQNAVIPDSITADPHVSTIPYDGSPFSTGQYSIGALKAFACQHATGDVYVELDHDDMLTPNALEEIATAFEDPLIMMAYSNTAEFKDGTWEPHTYSPTYGWVTRPFQYNDHALKQNIAWPPSPHSFRHIFWAPNHVRAWRATAYHNLSGHNPDLPVADDQDLNIRFYLRYGAAGIRHIDKCLYLYRVYPESNCRTQNADIQRRDQELYDKHIVQMALRWAKDEGLPAYDLGGAIDPQPGFITVDRANAHINCDLSQPWPFGDNTVGVVRASHILEHLPDPIHTMNELYRVLAPGGWVFIEVPSTDGRGAFQDPTHTSFWNENSFWYYTRATQARYIPDFHGRFQVSNLKTYCPTPWWKENNIPIVQAHLIALKPPYSERPAGEVLI